MKLAPPTRMRSGTKTPVASSYNCRACGTKDPQLFCPTKGDKCRPCLATWQREYRKRRSTEYWITKDRQYALKKRYGLTAEVFAEMFKAQAGKCAACGVDPKDVHKEPRHQKLHVDHNHATGAVRALLCNGCNRALGFVQDNPETLTALRRYLERHS